MVCQDVAALIDNETGAEAAYLLIAVGRVGTAKEIKEIKGILLSRILIVAVVIVATAGAANRGFRGGLRINVHDGGIQVRRDLRKRIGKRDRVGDDERCAFCSPALTPPETIDPITTPIVRVATTKVR